ncbi:restriction endonuclease subunit S [Pseudomonas sp. NY15354]|uniref:restriction endonuclease subunit S n=1 Tax=Pseudomonas sp. NY15354 TaxID=3400351 RepID=UPI003A877770
MTFPAYPAYKDSGVEWLGDVPESWAVTLLKRGYEVVLGKMLQPEAKRDDDEFLPYLRAANIQVSGVDTADVKKMWFSVDEKKSLLLRRGDLLVSEGGDVGRSAIWDFDEEFYFQNSINRIRSIAGNDTRFLYFWMITIKNNGYVDVLCNKSTIAHFTAEKVAAVPLPIPSKHEQTQIARFLDHETARIDALIEEQQRLIELLKEKRQAVISHAVTKGLDPTVPMKDSGVEWLGEVPAHWGTNALNKLTVKITNGYVGPTRDILVESGVPYVQATHIKRGVVNFDDAYFVTPEWSMRMSKSILQEGDVLIVQTGAGTGDVGIVSSREVGYNCHALIILQAEKSILSGVFLGQVLQSHFGQSVLYSIRTGGMHPHLNCGEVKFVKIPVPPLTEQEEISNFVKAFSEKAENLIIEAGATMDLLQERRSALISAAVTGKIDVRCWQPPASTQAPELALAEAV